MCDAASIDISTDSSFEDLPCINYCTCQIACSCIANAPQPRHLAVSFFDSLIQHLVQGSAFLNQLVHLASFVHVDHTRISGITFMITLVGPCFFDLILASAQDATAYDLHMAASFIFMQVRS